MSHCQTMTGMVEKRFLIVSRQIGKFTLYRTLCMFKEILVEKVLLAAASFGLQNHCLAWQLVHTNTKQDFGTTAAKICTFWCNKAEHHLRLHKAISNCTQSSISQCFLIHNNSQQLIFTVFGESLEPRICPQNNVITNYNKKLAFCTYYTNLQFYVGSIVQYSV